MTRLKSDCFGQWIDTTQPKKFTFEDNVIEGFDGDSVASALLANQVWVQSRSFKYHRPRGPLTLSGQDANTLVQSPKTPNLLADRVPVEEGLQLSGQNYSGWLGFDLSRTLDWFGRFLPVGFYYKAFFKPRGMWALWEPIVRRAAGLGTSNLSVKAAYSDKTYLFCDVAVIGGGPAGLHAALKVAEGGAEVLLIEQDPSLGGSLNYHAFCSDLKATQKQRDTLISNVFEHPNIKVLQSATCNAWFSDHYLPVLQGHRLFKVRAKQTLLATGSSEQHAIFRNNDLPGVVMCSAVDRLSRLYGVIPEPPLAVLAGNDLAYKTAFSSHDAGGTVVAIIDLRAQCDDQKLRDEAEARGIQVYAQCVVYEASSKWGAHTLSRVDVHALHHDSSVGEKIASIDCGILAMSVGYMPAYQLACQAGALLQYDDASAQFSISNLPKGMHIAGSINSVFTLSALECDARNAARAALRALDIAVEESDEAVDCRERVNHPWPFVKHPKGREFVDFDEDLQIKDIVNATRMGYRDIQLVKRFSTVGMGPSQGRHSALPTARLVAKATDRSVTQTGVTTARPPLTPEPLGLLAGRRFHPLRRTALHHRHLALHGQMIPAGSWQRPAYYGQPADRRAAIDTEVTAVRTGVGLIDVSTLGGIDLRGPDAPEFMNRLYTFGFVKQPVGKTRYAVMTNEQGVVSDDGVAARLSEHHYYVTATTTGVDQVYRDMLKWNAQWRLDLDITNVTSALSAVNLAGPLSREVLRQAGCDLDLSPEQFPYLAYREATIGRIPTRLMRVGFVGELGYELHVPSPLVGELWDTLMTAGQAYGIRPFGVEAQRLLRLEKGHIIVGQDTDGMTHPNEVALRWAIAQHKPFYVGSRSVEILSSRPLERQLVGFELSDVSPQPMEGHLVVRDGEIVGSVTSCEFSPTLQKIIGLAYVHPEDASAGSQIVIRTESGVCAQAHVVKTPFYDPDNKRQSL